MTPDTLRTLIRSQLDRHGITPSHAARLADLPRSVVQSYLAGGDATTARALALAAAVGVSVSAAPARGFRPPPQPTGGRPKKPAGIPAK